jgi:methyl-accepting chemotaxis protein
MSLARLRDWSMRTKLVLLLAIPLGGLLVFMAAAYRALTQLRVNGPVYQRLADADELIADVLPPPEYVIEAYLTLFQQLDQTHRATSGGDLIDKTRRLEQTFEARRQFWSDTLPPGALRTELLDGAAREARAFFDLERSQFIPALARGDLAAARAVAYGPLAETYERHRRAVDRVVDLARQAKLAEERAAEVQIWAWSAAMIGVGVLTFLLTALGGLLVATAIARPVGCTRRTTTKGRVSAWRWRSGSWRGTAAGSGPRRRWGAARRSS